MGPWYTAYLRALAVTCCTSVQPAGIRPDSGSTRVVPLQRGRFASCHGLCVLGLGLGLGL